MANGWESFKEDFVKENIQIIALEIEALEKVVLSPIERIVAVLLHFEFTFFNSMGGMVRLSMQYKIGSYTADFYLEYKSRNGLVKVVIECDGHEFHEKTKEQVSNDKKRDRYMQKEGYIVLRYSGSDIVRNPKQILDDIYSIMVRCDISV